VPAQKQNRWPEAPLAGLSTEPRHLGGKIGVYQRGLIGSFASHSSTRSIPQSGRQNIVKNTRLALCIFLYVFDFPKYVGRIGDFFPDFPGLTGNSQCAPTARITSGGGFHPDSSRFDLVAGKRLGGATGRAEALRQRPPWAVEQSDGP
jgi:hypothetical protein